MVAGALDTEIKIQHPPLAFLAGLWVVSVIFCGIFVQDQCNHVAHSHLICEVSMNIRLTQIHQHSSTNIDEVCHPII